jgi:probable HAF family extracellular repeat protein
MAQVAGTSSAGVSNQSAFRNNSYAKGSIEDVGGKPDGSISRGFGIDASGQVVGDSTFGRSPLASSRDQSARRAALFYKDSALDLGVLTNGGKYSRANSINASGQVVGFSGPKLDGDDSRAFIWSASTGMQDLGTLGGAYAQAFAINDSGFVTGNSQIALASRSGAVHAFISQPLSITSGPTKKMRDLGTLGGNYSYGMFINGDNHVVGYSTVNSSDDRAHAFLHDGTKMRDLGSLGGKALESDQSFALGVNIADEIVGYSYLPVAETADDGPIHAPQQVAFFYSQGVMVDLNGLIGDAAKNYRLDAATAINDKGQIVAIALDNSNNAIHAVLLTPTGK